MPIPGETYLPFSQIAIQSGHTSYSPQWSKTATCDRLINLIYDEALTHASPASLIQRLQAIIKYSSVKRGMGQSWYPFADADTRSSLRDYTLNNALVEFNEGQIGRCGRFHRALMSVINETRGHNDKLAAFQIWLNDLVLGLAETFNLLEPPVVADTTTYRINAGPAILNTGSNIALSAGDRIDMYTTGIGFVSSQWEKDTADIPGAVEESYRISSVVVGDSGTYINQFTNQTDNTPSPAFELVVT